MDYIIGGHHVRVVSEGGDAEIEALLPSFRPFVKESMETADPLLAVSLCHSLGAFPDSECRRITDADTGNGIIRVQRRADGSYQFIICNTAGKACALLQTTAEFDSGRCAVRGGEGDRRYGMNGVMMLMYAFRGAQFGTLLIHASVVRHAGRAYAFTAVSGTGKSTQVSNWLNNIEGCDLVNDDNPIVRVNGGEVMLYGSPWSGKTACYRNIRVPLGAILKIERDTTNYVTPLPTLEAFAVLLTACSAIRTDEVVYKKLGDVVAAVVERTTMATLHCLPDAESALVCRRYLED